MSLMNEQADLIAGSTVGNDWPGIYVVGSFDDRITFFAQQVRAMNLVDALVRSGTLQDGGKIAVIGAGAAGLATAASLVLLLPKTRVTLFEKTDKLMPLQSESSKRNLHPHIYDWPKPGAENSTSDLPIMDWPAGTAKDVATIVVQKFRSIISAVESEDSNRKFDERCSTTVNKITKTGPDYHLSFTDHGDNNEPHGGVFRTVFFTVGFGDEKTKECFGRQWPYWDDTSFPGAHYQGNIKTVIVSGGGDGGLIDFSAAALRNFNHSNLIKHIVDDTPTEIKEALLGIDHDAVGKLTFDFMSAYDDQLLGKIKYWQLTRYFRSNIYTGRNVILNSETDRPLYQNNPNRRTSTMNRFIAYLLLKVKPEGWEIAYRGGALDVIDAGKHLYKIAEDQLTAQLVLTRHGPERKVAFANFPEIQKAYLSSHGKWLHSFPNRSSPILTASANQELIKACDAFGISHQRIARTNKTPRQLPAAAAIKHSASSLIARRICVLPIDVPKPHPANLLMVMGANRQSAIAVTVDILGDDIATGLSATEEMLQNTGRAHFSRRGWASSSKPQWPTADGPRGLIWCPEKLPSQSDLIDAMVGGRWTSQPDAGDALVIALHEATPMEAKRLAKAIQRFSGTPSGSNFPDVPIYSWMRGSSISLTAAESDDPALLRLVNRLHIESGEPDLSEDVEIALAMRMRTIADPGAAWDRASRHAVRLHDMSLLYSVNVETPLSIDIERAVALVALSSINQNSLVTIPFLPVSEEVFAALLDPRNLLARAVAGPASVADFERLRLLGQANIAEAYCAVRSQTYTPQITIKEASYG
jgi:hypothetical protein